jgi:pyrroloquinoline quinone (PQQ) biosynthesis protein C
MKFFLELVSSTDEARREFECHPVVADAVANGMALDRYRRLLLELYHVVWHFNPVCAAAASRLDDRYQRVRHYLYEHMHEEAGHEEWVLNDLEAIGVDRGSSRAHAPSAFTLALNGFNYWMGDRGQPCAVLGMLYALEVISSVYGGPFATALKERLLLEDDRGVSFINSHASLDTRHMEGLRHVLNQIDDPASRAAVVQSTAVNFHHFTRILEAV